jgi:membrane-anchored protein YejM (alkaline phosphatase superfamily)
MPPAMVHPEHEDRAPHPVALASLGALLVGVHEVLFAHACPLSWGDAAYLQAVVLAQALLLAWTAGVAMALAPRFARGVAGAAFTLPALVYVDALVIARVDRHLPGVLALLLDAHLDDNRRLLAATGIDPRVVALAVAALAALAAAGAWLDAKTQGFARRRFHPTRRRVLAAWLAGLLVLGGLEAGASAAVSSTGWTQFSRAVPQVLGALGPAAHALTSLRGALRPRPSDGAVADAVARLEVPATPAPGDVFFFVVESLRADALDPARAPALAALARDGLSIGAAVSGGDVTQYGWYSLFASQPALYWDRDEAAGDARGAVSLRIARRRGWRVEVLTSNGLGYMGIDETTFGRAMSLADDVLDLSRTEGDAGARDERLMRELAARAERPHAPTVFVVSLDATHLPYDWGAAFVPPRTPYADARHYLRVQTTDADRDAVRNRYWDAVAFEDRLIGAFLESLRARRGDGGRDDDATVVVVGDHGEELWEHGTTGHGSEPCGIQTHVALVLSPSRAMRAGGDWSARVPLASTVDVWPTLLDAAGVRGDLAALVAGRSLLRGPSGAAVAAHQRYWYRPARFVVDDGEEKVVLELSDPEQPFRVQPIHVLALLDAREQPLLPGATAAEYGVAIEARFGRDLRRVLALPSPR